MKNPSTLTELLKKAKTESFYKVSIDPKFATLLLEINTANRTLSSNGVNTKSGAIERDEWLFNGSPIRVSKTGILLDGQHRLEAVVRSGIAIVTLIVYGLDDKVMPTIDTGMNLRRFADVLSMEGGVYNRLTSSIISMIREETISNNPLRTSGKNAPTIEQLSKLYRSNPEVTKSADFVGKHPYAAKLTSPRILGYAHWSFSKRHPEAAEKFLIQLNDGLNLSKTDPVNHLRIKLQNISGANSHEVQFKKLAYLFQLFDAYLDGKPITRMPPLSEKYIAKFTI